jgi:hypothetical protein
MDVSSDTDYEGQLPEESPARFESLLTEALSAGVVLAGKTRVVIINEPIFVANGRNHLIRYNELYPHWVYDEYRQFLRQWMEQRNYTWLDHWNAIPPEEFVDQYFHRRSSGEKRFAEALAPEIQKMICPE